MDPTSKAAFSLIFLCCFQYAPVTMGTKIPEVNLGKEFGRGTGQAPIQYFYVWFKWYLKKYIVVCVIVINMNAFLL
jgi:hypothetical protein